MKSRINNIQLLRAFAAVSVAIFHTGYQFPHLQHFGYFGVPVFFVISGYIMAMISTTKPEHFLLRRVIRIVPPYWAMTLLLFFFVHWQPGLVKSANVSIPELLKSLFFIPFVKGNGLMMPLLFLGWTLNYEMFFYLTLALALWISARRAPAVATVLILLTLFLCGFLTHTGVIWRFYSDTVTLDFVLGMAAFYVCKEFPLGVPARIRPLLVLLLLAAAGALILIEGRGYLGVQPFWILLGIPSAVLIASAALLSQSGWDINVKSIIAVGDASYILYLIHPYLEFLISRVLATRIHWLAPDKMPGFVIALSCAVLVSLFLHVKIELPVVNYLNRKLVRRSVRRTVPV